MPQFGRKRFFFGVLAWSAFLLTCSLLPHDTVIKILPSEKAQSLAHTAAYGTMTWLLCFYLRFHRFFAAWRMTDFKVYVLAFMITFLWGGVTEMAQMLRPDRYTQWEDCLFNALGSALGLTVFIFWQSHHHKHWTKQ